MDTRDIFSPVNVKDLISPQSLISAAAFAAVLLIVWFLFTLIHRIVMKHAQQKCRPQTQQIISKCIRYIAFTVIVISVLNKFGINVSALLGAAGIAGIAVGFAAQTTISNVISGLFIMTERSFETGDFITVGSVSGTVESIDMLSIKLRTPDNQLARVPNETVIKSSVVNATHFPVRRLSLDVAVSYNADIADVRQKLIDIATSSSLTLSDPAPVAQITGFGDSAVNVQLWCWTNKDSFIQYRTEMYQAVQSVFNQCGITIPFPHVDVSVAQGKNVNG